MTDLDLSSVMSNIRDLAYIFEPDGTVSFVSERVADYGYLPKEVVGRNIAEFIHPDDLPKVLADFKVTMETGREFPTAFRLRGKSGGFIEVEDLGRAIKENGRVVSLVGTIRDITERRKIEKDLAEKMAEMKLISDAAIGRETKMIALEQEVNQLLQELGREEKYK
ncbi:MAG: PAS domain-containing protein [Candidatus Margulisiibacteriota bacterium]